MSLFAFVLTELTAELALFAAAGYLLFALDDLVVDLIYFLRRGWRAAIIYSRYPKMHAGQLPSPMRPGWMAVLIPAWDEAAVVAPMLRSTLDRFGNRPRSRRSSRWLHRPSRNCRWLTVRSPVTRPMALTRPTLPTRSMSRSPLRPDGAPRRRSSMSTRPHPATREKSMSTAPRCRRQRSRKGWPWLPPCHSANPPRRSRNRDGCRDWTGCR